MNGLDSYTTGGSFGTEPVAQDPFATSTVPVYHDPFGFDQNVGASAFAANPVSDERRQAFISKLGDTSLGHMLRDAYYGFTQLPEDVMSGKVDVSDPSNLSDETMGRVLGLAAMAGAPFASGVEQTAGKGVLGASLRNSVVSGEENLASRSASIYNPPAKPLRPFEADYPPSQWPDGPPVDAQGNLTKTIDGQPITARYLVSRKVVGGEDQAVSPAEFDSVTEGSIGQGISLDPASALPRGAVGTYRVVLGPDGPERSIGLLNTLNPQTAVKVGAHEMGHMIDELSGQIPTDGISAELRSLYNSLNNGNRNYLGTDARANAPVMTPKHFGYRGDDVPREYMAEAIRAYMADPNYIKTVAPNTAGRIRAYVNNNPRLNSVIQFNSGGIPGAGYVLEPVDHDPFAAAGSGYTVEGHESYY